MLKSIGSRSVQMNPMTFSRGYWAVVVSKLFYGMFLVNLKKRSLDKLDKMHVDVAKNIQGLAPNIYIYTCDSSTWKHQVVANINTYCCRNYDVCMATFELTNGKYVQENLCTEAG